MRYLATSVLFGLLLTGVGAARTLSLPVTERPLHEGWTFRQSGKDKWLKAEVPGVVHTDLLKNGLIGDPFYRNNEKGQQWIGYTDWEYRLEFEISDETRARENLEIVFEGLDTYAEVFLNERKVLAADNMFRRWVVDIKDAARPGANVLLIRFRSPINEILPRMKKLSYELPASNDQGEKTSPYTRKAPYQYGWDWGPRFVTSGIWRPVSLRSWDGARIEDLHIRQKALSKERAELAFEVELHADRDAEAEVLIRNETEGTVAGRKKIKLAEGVNEVLVPYTIVAPRLWYPAGLGRQDMYEFSAELLIGGRTADKISERTGLRTAELVQQPDQWGKSFMFVVNGIPVFGKGGNWIPADSFPTRVTPEKYRQLLTSVRDANMNMVRVWGGGIYEDKHFYDLADELGLLVWQDFMFACSMYPADRDFLENVRQEAIDNIKRLRDHPSVILWCGNNEVETAWNHWGWRQNLPDRIWEDYLKLFVRLLPEVVEEYDPETPYWSSSPSSNFQEDSDSQKMGDVHYWGVWHAALPFTDYEKQFPRFMSEYGFQSFPLLETVESYTTEEDRASIETPVMLAHQRHPRGNQLIREYMLREFEEPKDFESFLYVSQVLQAEGIRTGTEHLRRIMPQNMGALYWQINDCWPVASWSGMDYYGRWKAMHHYARRFFEPVLVSPYYNEGEVKVFIVSDLPEKLSAELEVTLFDLSGRELWTKTEKLRIDPLSSKPYLTVGEAELFERTRPDDAVLLAELRRDDGKVTRNMLYFKPYKDLKMKRPNIVTNVSRTENGYQVSLKTDTVARAVHLLGPAEGVFKDNFFDLVPGREHVVEFESNVRTSPDAFRKALRTRSLYDAF